MTGCIGSKLAALALLVSTLVGCGGSSEEKISGPKGTVSGKITLEGKAVPQGCVVQFSDTTSRGFHATGIVAADGMYTLSLNGSGEIPVGDYRVFVGSPPPPQLSAAEYEEQMKNPEKAKSSSTPVIPEKFGSNGESVLKFTVKEGKNAIDIPLTNAGM